MKYENRISIVGNGCVHHMAGLRWAMHWRGRAISEGFNGFDPQRG